MADNVGLGFLIKFTFAVVVLVVLVFGVGICLVLKADLLQQGLYFGLHVLVKHIASQQVLGRALLT